MWFWGSAELKRYIPGNIWSLIGRATNFSQKNISKSVIFSTSLLEAEFIVVSSLFLSLFAINFIVYGLLPEFPYKAVMIVGIIILSFLFIILFLGNAHVIKLFQLKHAIKIEKWQLKLNFLPHFSFKTNLTLFFIESLALFLFGLGTYFSISSFVILYPEYITTFIGFFVFSLLIGYISLITPMGLGIREGIITVGLTKFISLSLAGFGALFARVVFILAELLFILIAFYWYKTKNMIVLTLEKKIKKQWQPIILCLVLALYVLYMTTATLLRYDNFYTGRFDLGNMDQTVWNTLHGRIFQLTDPNGTRIVSRLAFHADFILIFLAPFYLLWQNPKMLLIIQTVVLAFGGMFVYSITKKVLKNKTTALLFACLYCINPGINYTNLYDFHGVTLATTFLLGAFYFLQNKKWFWYSIFLILAGLTKEEVWIIIAFFGLYTMIVTKNENFVKKLLGPCIFFLAMSLCSFLILYAIPHAKGSAHFALAYYADFGSSPSEIIKSIIFKPQKTIMIIFQPQQLQYVLQLFSPLGFLSLASPLFFLFALPELLIDLLSKNSGLHQIYYQYSATITPFIFISAIFGFKNFVKRFPKLQRYAHYYLVIMTLLSAYFFGPLPGGKNANVHMFDTPLSYTTSITNFIHDIPRRYSIAATNNVGSHLSHRQKIFTIPVGIDTADIIIFLLNDSTAQPSLDAQKQIVANMKQDKNYIEIFKQGDFIVFEKRNLYLQKEPNLTHTKLFPLSIPSLQHRDYVGGKITIEGIIKNNTVATTYAITYLSDGLKLSASMQVPQLSMPTTGYPVIMITPDPITKNGYDTRIADAFAQKGFLVIQPEYRGIGNSETDMPLLAPLPYSIDILNLVTSLPTVYEADSKQVFLWGQGLGGEVTLKTLEIAGDNADKTLQQAIKGAVVWSPIITPDQWSNETTMYDSLRKRFGQPQKNPIFWQSISVKNYIDDIHTPIEIDQGTADAIIPYTTSIELYDDLVSYNKNAKLKLFSNDDHEITQYKKQAIQGNIDFFKKLLTH